VAHCGERYQNVAYVCIFGTNNLCKNILQRYRYMVFSDYDKASTLIKASKRRTAQRSGRDFVV